MRLRAIVPTLLFAAVVAVALGPSSSLAVGSDVMGSPGDAGTVFIHVQDQVFDGACIALDPELVRPHLRGAFCTLLCIEPQSAEAEVTEATRVLRRAPLANREAAVDELLLNVAVRDTAETAKMIPGIAERYGLDESALREVVVIARERLLEQLRDDGLLDATNATCLLERLHTVFGPVGPSSDP